MKTRLFKESSLTDCCLLWKMRWETCVTGLNLANCKFNKNVKKASRFLHWSRIKWINLTERWSRWSASEISAKSIFKSKALWCGKLQSCRRHLSCVSSRWSCCRRRCESRRHSRSMLSPRSKSMIRWPHSRMKISWRRRRFIISSRESVSWNLWFASISSRCSRWRSRVRDWVLKTRSWWWIKIHRRRLSTWISKDRSSIRSSRRIVAWKMSWPRKRDRKRSNWNSFKNWPYSAVILWKWLAASLCGCLMLRMMHRRRSC